MYLPVIIGFIYVLFKTSWDNTTKVFLIGSGIVFAVVFPINFFISFGGIERIFTYGIPFIALYSGITYSYVLTIQKKQITRIFTNIVVGMILIFMAFLCLVGLQGEYYAPIHLYNPSINWSEIGEHNPHFQRINVFLRNNPIYYNYTQIASDDIALLNVILPSSEFDKIEPITMQTLSINGSRLLIVLNGFHIYNYGSAASTVISEGGEKINSETINATEEEIKELINDNYLCIFDNGDSSIWEKQ